MMNFINGSVEETLGSILASEDWNKEIQTNQALPFEVELDSMLIDVIVLDESKGIVRLQVNFLAIKEKVK
ncbi:hypothetical protein MKY96_00345 [Paenibacillus sp. FSL R7-0302]|uniref:hypothetical protein n=1 Tax=Paenibacillus sp. FSL R7-0302 TaxID=2921681 RepID=UPI0030F4F091